MDKDGDDMEALHRIWLTPQEKEWFQENAPRNEDGSIDIRNVAAQALLQKAHDNKKVLWRQIHTHPEIQFEAFDQGKIKFGKPK